MSKRERWIQRVKTDFNALTKGLDKGMKEINPTWGILNCKVGGSFGQYLKGEKEMFKTPYSGISGMEQREEVLYDPEKHLSDIDAVCWVTDKTDIWYKAGLVSYIDNKMRDSPEKFGLKSRKKKCINFADKEIKSKYCNDAFRLPHTEHNLQRTHDVILHLKKRGEKIPFGLKWKAYKEIKL